MTCHLCSTLGGLRISYRGQAVPCHCPAGDKWRAAARQQSREDTALGLVPAGQSLVQPWTEAGRTVLIGGGQ